MSGPRLVVGALIVDSISEPTRLLAARRASPTELAGRWEFPGGKVESDETPEGALRRELTEELGITAHVGAELVPPGGSAWPISDRYELRLFYCTADDEEVRLDGSHDEVRWVTADEIDDLPWLDSDRDALPYVFAGSPLDVRRRDGRPRDSS